MKKILVILLIVVIASLSIVGATAIYTTVAATLRPDIKVTLDGQELSLQDADGDTITPLIVDGSTYLPVRAIAGALGIEIIWDEKTQTVKLNTGAEPQEPIAPLGVRGTVKDIVQGKDGVTFTVVGQKQLDTRFDTATITVTGDTVLENIASYSEIKEGYIVEVVCPEVVAMSYPVISGAEKLTVIAMGEIGVRGTVKDIVQGKDGVTFLVEGKKENDTQYDKARVTVNMKTVLENVASFGEIKEGDNVEVKFGGAVAESYPVMGTAAALKILK